MSSVPIGQTIGPYRIIQQIGQGGMATVYKAYQPAMDRYVALKILPRQLAESPEFMGRFRQEARTIARLEHAHILPVHDYGESDGYTYLAMRFVEAGTLKDRLQASPPTPAEIDRYFVQLADALDYAHVQGVVHRDLKPSNVLLDARGNLFLTDFGIAKLLEADSRFTGSGALIGTPAYMSPEQAQGLKVDRRTDIYSLGIMLYEMLTGRLPFEADTPLAIILKQINDPLPPPSSIKPDISPAVERVVLKALAKNPEDRFSTVAEFSAAWQAAQRATMTRTAAASPPASASVAASAVASAAASSASAPTSLGSAPPVASAVSLPAASAPRARLGRGLPLLAGGALLLVALLACGGLLALAAFRPAWLGFPARASAAAPNGTVVGAVNATAASNVTPAPNGTPSAGTNPGVAGSWRSWSAANNMLAVTLFNGQLLSGGLGGVTAWNLADGSVASRLTTGNGLPNANVYALLPDDAAHTVWIATGGGLVAYDGQHATVYDQTNGLDSDTVTALAHTKRGLLVGSANSGRDGGGLGLWVNSKWQAVADFPSTSQPDTVTNKISTEVRAILEDAQGNLWIGTSNGLGRYDGQAWTRFSTADGLPDNSVFSLAEAGGAIWVGTDSGAAHFDGKAFVPLLTAQGRAVYGFLPAANGDLWLGGNGGTLRQPAGGGQLQIFDNTSLPVNDVYRGVEAADGTLFFGSDSGLLRYRGKSFDLWTVPNVPRYAGYQHVLAGQTAGQVWFVQQDGTNTDLLDPTPGTWRAGPSLPCDACAPLTWGPDGRLWAGSSDGMWIIQGTQATHVSSDQGLPSGSAWAVAFARDGTTWIGTSAGVAVYSGSQVKTVYTAANAGLADDSINHLLAAADGSVWVATDDNLSRHAPDGQWIHYGPGSPFLNDVRINGLAQDASGAVWVATNGEGVYRFAGDVWTQFRPAVGGVRLASSEVLCVAAARDGSVWFGTSQGGAARFDGSAWQAFTVADGLIDATVNDIYVDGAGAVWSATSGGVSQYRP